MRRPLALVFALTFACGALTAALLVRHTPSVVSAHVAAQTHNADGDLAAVDSTSDDADPGDADSSNDWPDDAETPEQVIYAQPHMLREAVA